MPSSPPAVSPSRRPVHLRLSKIIAAIWVGLFAYQGMAAYLLPDALFVLVLTGLAAGTILTTLTFVFALKWTSLIKYGP